MPGSNRPLITVVINNYNYARFLPDAIASCLNQSYAGKELIVVDDGSSDNSREIIESYGEKIIPIFKENGGQGSAINAGFLRSHGELLIFLDADDFLENDVLEEIARHWDGKATKLHYRLDVIDLNGTIIGQDPESAVELPHGNIQAKLVAHGHYITPPSSGNAFSRKFVEAVSPIPEEPFRRAADSYLFTLAALHGDIIALPRVGGKYRMHGANGFFKRRRFSTVKDLVGILERQDRCVALIDNFVKQRGLERTYSPKYYLAPNFTRLLLLRAERKLDYATTFRLLGYCLYSIFYTKSYGFKQRLVWIAKTLLVAFAPMRILWRAYPNIRPPAKPVQIEKTVETLAVGR